MSENFRFWVPLDTINKSTDKEGRTIMKVGGIASTKTKDMDGESLDPEGFDISYLKNKGIVNWNHNKSPNAIIGEPTKANITKAGLHVECELYPDNPLANQVYELAETLEKNSKTRRLGFSIEGKATERDELDPTKVTKAMVTNIALTISPKNPDSIVNIIKGNFNELNDDELKPYDLFNSDSEIGFLKSIEDNIEKAMEAGSETGTGLTNQETTGAALKTESVEGSKFKKSKKKSDLIKDNPCWEGYEALGMKEKDGKTVPNCVKKGEDDEEDESIEKGEKGSGEYDHKKKKATFKMPSKKERAAQLKAQEAEMDEYFEETNTSKEGLIQEWREHCAKENDDDGEYANTLSDELILDDLYSDYIPFTNWQNKKAKNNTLNKAEVLNTIMNSSSVISFEKANQIYETINSIAMSTKIKTDVTEDLLAKALTTLGINKGMDESEEDLDKGCDDDEEEKEIKEPKKGKKPAFMKKAMNKKEEEDEDEEDNDEEDMNDEDEDEEEKMPIEKKGQKPDFMKKGDMDTKSHLTKLQKSINDNSAETLELFRGLGILVKGMYDEIKELRAESVDRDEKISKSLDEFGSMPAGVRKSKSVPLNKTFEKGFGGEEDGQATQNNANILSVSQNRDKVLSVLDAMTFEKGFDAEMGKAMTTFESSGTLDGIIVSKILASKNIQLVK